MRFEHAKLSGGLLESTNPLLNFFCRNVVAFVDSCVTFQGNADIENEICHVWDSVKFNQLLPHPRCSCGHFVHQAHDALVLSFSLASLCWIERPACLLKQFSLTEIVSTAVLPADVVVDPARSSMLLTQLCFKLPTGAHLLLVECRLRFQWP